MPLSARAGDKIEFSAPSASLEVPRVERIDKEPPKSGMQAPMPAVNMFPEEMQVSPEIVIISTPKEKDLKTGDSAFTDNRDNNTDADSRYDNVDSSRRPINGATNRWDMPGGWNPDAESISPERRRDEAASQDDLRTRLEAMNTAGRTNYQKDERYGRRSSDSDEDSAWSRSFFHHGSPGLERMREGRFVPFYEEIKMINEQFSQGYSSARLFSAPNGLPRDSTLPPGAAEYTSQRDVARGNTLDETGGAPRTIHPEETTTVSQNPDVFARKEPPASTPSQVQSRPAILPFPKKPGSVFQ
jgi:hypothetical protein